MFRPASLDRAFVVVCGLARIWSSGIPTAPYQQPNRSAGIWVKSSIWVKSNATTNAWSRSVEAGRTVAFRFKLHSKVSVHSNYSTCITLNAFVSCPCPSSFYVSFIRRWDNYKADMLSRYEEENRHNDMVSNNNNNRHNDMVSNNNNNRHNDMVSNNNNNRHNDMVSNNNNNRHNDMVSNNNNNRHNDMVSNNNNNRHNDMVSNNNNNRHNDMVSNNLTIIALTTWWVTITRWLSCETAPALWYTVWGWYAFVSLLPLCAPPGLVSVRNNPS